MPINARYTMASTAVRGTRRGSEAIDPIDQRGNQMSQEDRERENHQNAASEVDQGDGQYEQKRGPHCAQDAPVDFLHGY